MDTFEPLINLFVLLSALSVAAERATNVLKLNREHLRNDRGTPEGEKARERDIAWLTLGVSAVVAILMKANLFEILGRLDAPWATLGWAHLSGGGLVRAASITGPVSVLYAIGGSMLTAVALGFGSKFWHEMLDIVFSTRERLKNAAQGGAR